MGKNRATGKLLPTEKNHAQAKCEKIIQPQKIVKNNGLFLRHILPKSSTTQGAPLF